MTLHEAHQQLLTRLYQVYEKPEAANICNWVMEHITGMKRVDRVIHKAAPLSLDKEVLLQKYTDELLVHKPVQYVLQEAWFYGMKLYVDEHVLIPRPETEELVEWVVMNQKQGTNSREPEAWSWEPGSVLDIGTGSGCIPIALKKRLPGFTVYTCDISEKALAVAKRNATAQKADIRFLQVNILDSTQWSLLPGVDIIVSNPPYVPQQDKSTMEENVVRYEPHLALFVDNNDPLQFYKKIADLAKLKLNPGGEIYVEIHEELGQQARELFIAKGYHHVEVKKDMQGKDRMVRVSQEPIAGSQESVVESPKL